MRKDIFVIQKKTEAFLQNRRGDSGLTDGLTWLTPVGLI
jgi:hypothetical protein